MFYFLFTDVIKCSDDGVQWYTEYTATVSKEKDDFYCDIGAALHYKTSVATGQIY